jgi:transcriptional regulator with XRE-family HTH domain
MEDLLRNLGSRIRELRVERGWSQEKFSEICDVHRTWMGQIERGKNVSVNTLANIAGGLGVTLSTLLEGVEGGTTGHQSGSAPSGKVSARIGPVIRAGPQTVNMLVEEIKAERAALERTVATLRLMALARRPKRKSRSSRRPSRKGVQ